MHRLDSLSKADCTLLDTANIVITETATSTSSREVVRSVDYTIQESPDTLLCQESVYFVDFEISSTQTGRLQVPIIYGDSCKPCIDYHHARKTLRSYGDKPPVCGDDFGTGFYIALNAPGSPTISCDPYVYSVHPDFSSPSTRPVVTCDIDYSAVTVGECVSR